MSTTSYKHLTREISSNMAALHKGVPDVMKGFGDMAKAAIAVGALSSKTKELIALSIGVANRCDGCIGFHTKALHKLGATRLELEEMLGIAVYMGGGPALMYAAEALSAWDKLTDPASA